ncbi:MAG: hypothetical protein JRI89_02400 [Deltaproteobacteria bacterium]|nr:hypothetical protein [Deltaproteobacteria bacterium]
MAKLLANNGPFVVQQGVLYVPLLFDPEVQKEATVLAESGSEESLPVVLQVAGQLFVRSVTLESLVRQYGRLYPDSYHRLRTGLLDSKVNSWVRDAFGPDDKLQTIIFQIMPHFVGRRKGLHRRTLNSEEILALLAERLSVPASYYREAERYRDDNSLQTLLESFADTYSQDHYPADGLMEAKELQDWLEAASKVQFRVAEKYRLQKEVAEREKLAKLDKKYVALLLYIADKGSCSLDDFGLFREGRAGDYHVYVHTGEYALKDYYGRLYLFPDCRVAVSTSGTPRPYVLDRYKHPFLFRHAAKQEICMKQFTPATEFSAQNVIRSLELGLLALYHGYNPRRRNGYHSLDRVTTYVRIVNFDDYRIPADHPKIISGEVEVKNEYL